MLTQCQMISILPCWGLSLVTENHRGATAVHDTSDTISKPVNFNYFLSVKSMLEEGLLEFDHITLNTTIYCVTKQQIENWTFFH